MAHLKTVPELRAEVKRLTRLVDGAEDGAEKEDLQRQLKTAEMNLETRLLQDETAKRAEEEAKVEAEFATKEMAEAEAETAAYEAEKKYEITHETPEAPAAEPPKAA
jgi:hypothetical protein